MQFAFHVQQPALSLPPGAPSSARLSRKPETRCLRLTGLWRVLALIGGLLAARETLAFPALRTAPWRYALSRGLSAF